MSVVKRHIFICNAKKPDGIPDCSEKSGQAILDAFKSEIYKLNKEDEVMVSGSSCLGICDHGPTAVVYPEGFWYTKITLEDIPEIIQKHLLGGSPLTNRENLSEEKIKTTQKEWHGKMRAKFERKGKM